MKLIIYRIVHFEFKPQTSQTPGVLSGASRESAEVPILWRWSPCGTGTLYAIGWSWSWTFCGIHDVQDLGIVRCIVSGEMGAKEW